MKLGTLAMMALAATALPACGGDDAPTGTQLALALGSDAPAYGTAPFPTDAVREGDHLGAIAGLDALARLHADDVQMQVATLDGFGLRPVVEFPVTGALDPDTIPAHTRELADAVGLVDVDPGSPERGRVVAMEWRYEADRDVIAGRPENGQILREGTRYAAYVTSDVHAAGGEPLQRSTAMILLAAGDVPARWQTTAGALATVAAERPDVVGIAAFTTEHATAQLVAARAAFAQLPAPVLAFPDPGIVFAGAARLQQLMGTATRFTDGPRAGQEHWGIDNATGVAHDHVGVVGTGTITIAVFPAMTQVQPIPITFILPAAAPPATGYPVVIFGHGLGASRDQMMAFAEPLTAQGYAIVGIDFADQGSRYDPTDHSNNYATIIPGFTGSAAMPDGFGDTTGAATQFAFFHGFTDVIGIRTDIQQSALDLSRVVELVREPNLDLTPLAAGAKLDTRHLTYIAESFGTVVGTLFAAIEPDVDLYVLDVAGGGILDLILPSSAVIGSLALPLVEALYNPAQPSDRWSPLIGLNQAVLDGGDPLAYAPHVMRDRFPGISPRSVVIIEAVGDEVLPNVGTIALARELRLDALAPLVDDAAGLRVRVSPVAGNAGGQTGVLVQYEPATHGANWKQERGQVDYLPGFPQPSGEPFPKLPAPITVTEPLYATFDQLIALLASHQAGHAPVVQSTDLPLADFDGDGVVDREDRFPLDPTQH